FFRFAFGDVLGDVGGDVFNFFFGQDAFERGHPAAAVGDLLDRARFVLRQRHRRQVRAAVAAVTSGAVAGGAIFGEDDGARFGVTAGRGFRAFGFAFQLFTGVVDAVFLFGFRFFAGGFV